MSDSEVRPPPPRQPTEPNKSAVKHQRRPSFHARRRSQHSIASFGEIADDVIKAPALGSLGESVTEEEPSDDYEAGKVETTKKKHGRQSSNVHELFSGEDAMDNIVQKLGVDLDSKPLSTKAEGLMMDEDMDLDGYSPKAIELEDAPESPVVKPPPKAPSGGRRNQSFGGIVDLFDQDELRSGISNPEQEIKRLREENQRLGSELEKSNRIRKQLEAEIDALRSSKGHSSKAEIERIKTSKIRLILAAVSEIDRMRSIIYTHERNNSMS